MSLEKAVKHGKEKRRGYYGSQAFDHSCRPHGSCPYCESNRTFSDKKARLKAKMKEQIDEYIDLRIGAGDPTDAMMDHEEFIAEKIGVDIFELCMMEEDWSLQ
jgi:hypothetical protein